MTGFDRTPILAICDEAQKWQLVLPLRYRTADGETITIPAGFYTDLASIPRALHWLIPVNGSHRAAAILHDYLYALQDRPRSEADRLFLQAMQATNVPWLQRNAMWLGVRVGGWLVWQHHTRRRKANPLAYWRAHGLAPVRAVR